MIDPINSASLIISILPWIKKNAEKYTSIKKDKFINYSPAFNIEKYSASHPIAPHIPYEEHFNFLKTNKIDIIVDSEEFHVTPKNDTWKTVSMEGFQALKDDGRIKENEPAVRLYDTQGNDKHIRLFISKTFYHEQAKSNLILDFKSKESSLSLRDILIQNYKNELPPLNDESLANNVGIAVLIFYKHRDIWIPYMVWRQKKLGVFPGGLHCTASGVAKWPKSEAPTFENFFRKHMLSEIEEEVGLLEKDIYDFKIVSLCREFARGGKPQMFFAAKTNLSLKELIVKRKKAKTKIVQSGLRLEIKDRWLLPENIEEANTLSDDIKKYKLTLEAIASLCYAEQYLS